MNNKIHRLIGLDWSYLAASVRNLFEFGYWVEVWVVIELVTAVTDVILGSFRIWDEFAVAPPSGGTESPWWTFVSIKKLTRKLTYEKKK